ncbi:MAG: protein translocase subunit SecD [Paracoccaceae bacterium]
MMHMALWKRLFIWGLCLAAVVFAAPNFFYARVERHNDAAAKLTAGAAETAELSADLAAWPSYLPSDIVNLGLDLRGGAHLLAEVAVEDVYKSRMDGFWPELRKQLGAERATIGGIRRVQGPTGELRVTIEKPDGMARAIEVAESLASPVVTLTGIGHNDIEVSSEGRVLILKLSDVEKAATDDRTIQQSLEIVRRRVDAVGTREPTIQRQGENRILIQVPGIGSAAELKALIGTTAKLTFHTVIRETTNANEVAGANNVLLPSAEDAGVYYVLDDTPVVTGEDLVDAKLGFDQNGQPAVDFRFNPTGARLFGDYTAENIGQLFAIVLDNEVISAPRINSHIPGGSGIITGNFTSESATKLAVLLRAGALPASMTFLEERTVGPELGQDSIEAGKKAAIIGYSLVAVYMIASYGFFGVMASFALVINVAMIFALFSMVGTTLTLPGIAAIVLTMGMAVDANVLIFERIREELRAAKGPGRAIELGFEKALSAIVDSNITTLIGSAILFFLGSGPVKGFAVALSVGILTSVITAIVVTRLFVITWYGRKRPKSLIL